MLSYFKNRKTTYFDVFCLNFSIETKIKTIFQISYFNLSKEKTKWHFGYTDYVNLHVHDFTFYCNFHSNCYENLNYEIFK